MTLLFNSRKRFVTDILAIHFRYASELLCSILYNILQKIINNSLYIRLTCRCIRIYKSTIKIVFEVILVGAIVTLELLHFLVEE